MTGNNPQNDQAASAPHGGPVPESHIPAESLAARSLTDRSKAEEAETSDLHAADHQEERESGPRIWPRVVGVLILLLGAGGAWIWQNPGFLQHTWASVFPGSSSGETENSPIKLLEARVARLEARPSPGDLEPLNQRLAALERRASPTGATAGPASATVDLKPVLARLEALEARARQSAPPRQDTSSTGGPAGPDVLARLDALEAQLRETPAQRQATDGAPAQDLRPLVGRLDALEKVVAGHEVEPGKIDALNARVETLSARDPAAELRGRLEGMERQMSGLSSTDAKLADNTAKAMRLARLQAAAIALSAGRALGPIPDAPPALAKFTNVAPPTEARLRLAFATAAEAARQVSLPDTEGKDFFDRVLARLQDVRLITVREGDHLVIGNAAAATLTHAKMLLDVGDLGGAIKTVGTLTGPPAEKMAGWLADATSLVAAREALVSLADNG